MNKLYKTKQILIIVLIFIIIGAIVLSINPKKENNTTNRQDDTTLNIEEQKPIEFCYYRGDKATSGFYDIAWLKLNILGEKISGEFHNLPAESDSKIGTFEGTILPIDEMAIKRNALVWWNSQAEGMEVKEELAIEFGDNDATVGFGEMIDRGDGVYVYKDKTNLFYIKGMDKVDCGELDEKLFAEKYIRDNIGIIATNKPVLGGSWYVISVVINSLTDTGEITYEDGHIQSKANLIYSYEKNPQNITITKFEIIK